MEGLTGGWDATTPLAHGTEAEVVQMKWDEMG